MTVRPSHRRRTAGTARSRCADPSSRRFRLECRKAGCDRPVAATALRDRSPILVDQSSRNLRGGKDWAADLVHANDWQCALIPGYLEWHYAHIPTVFTIHNLAYQ